jgi:hypothetical protein
MVVQVSLTLNIKKKICKKQGVQANLIERKSPDTLADITLEIKPFLVISFHEP